MKNPRLVPEWASHIPLLVKIIQRSTGPVLEMGTGLFSTPLLHWMCIDGKRDLVSYENYTYYYDIVKKFETATHKIHLINHWDEADIIENKHWGVVFVDHQPDERRMVDIKRLANNADFIVIHDTETKMDHVTHFSEIWPLFKWRYNYQRQKPYTSVVSNFIDVLEVLRW